MVVLNSGHDESNMYSCRVLYIGSAPPVETLKGIEALQEPLRQRFPNNVDEVEGIDANVRVLPTDLEVTYQQSGQTLHFPLDRLTICAGVTAVNITDATTGAKHRQFVPLNTIQHDSRNPAIFAAIIRRSQGRQIAECHMFVCNSSRDALHLVNAAATANMALKQQKKSRKMTDTSGYGNDVVVIKTGVVDVPSNGFMNGDHQQTRTDTQYVQEVDIPPLEPQHYKIQQPPGPRASSPETIYVSFDKTNLVSTGDDTMEVRSRQPAPSPRYVEQQSFSYRPIAPPPPQPRPVPVMIARPQPIPPPPPPRPVMIRTRPAPPPPQPIIVRPPPPPPQPIYVRAPAPPPPQRMYSRRMVTVPPPPTRYVSPAPVYARTRARSVSPIRYAERSSKKEGLYQPKWVGETKRPASDIGFRMSRRDQYEYQGPPRDFRQPGNMFLNERAFSRRVHADDRISQMSPGYAYPNAYDYTDFRMYDRPTTKSNPRYSSSESSDDGRDNRMSKSYRK
ncbi:hypothetical protein ACF0H5_017243 [Mactra antiquata]